MAMMPKRVKHRKSQRGRIKGNATRGNRVVFGDFGLQSTQAGWIKAATIEAVEAEAQLPQAVRRQVSEDARVRRAGRLVDGVVPGEDEADDDQAEQRDRREQLDQAEPGLVSVPCGS